MKKTWKWMGGLALGMATIGKSKREIQKIKM